VAIGIILRNPTTAEVITPEGPFTFNTHPGSGSDFVHPTKN